VHLIGDRATPVLGINVGGLGFLTEIPLENFMEEFEKILQGKYRIEERLMLRGTINDNPEPLYALNEILIDKGSSVRVIQIEVEVEGHFLNSYIADGILVSTPTGSTGYSLSSGGPIVVPSTNVLVINPICPHSLTNRPTVIPADATIKAIIRTENPEFIIAADGRDVHYCKTRTHLTVEKAPYCAHLVKPLHSNFFHLLHSKLNWGKDFRDKTRWSHDS
jgi:NAD+ kinase